MDPYSLTLMFLIELLRYMTVFEQNMTVEDRARREKFWAFWDKVAEDFDKLKLPKSGHET
jgi:hypothetical protein